jgi:hypothetical protein
MLMAPAPSTAANVLAAGFGNPLPRGARAHKRVIWVVTPLSSRKIRRSTARPWICCQKASRRGRLASVSRFFTAQSQLLHDLPHSAAAQLHSCLRQQGLA